MIRLAVPRGGNDDANVDDDDDNDRNAVIEVKWRLGESLLKAIQREQDTTAVTGTIGIEGTCGGNASCSTCHVYLDKQTFAAIPPATQVESDLLDQAYAPDEESSRLACQVRLDEKLLLRLGASSKNTVTVTVPADANNLWE